jgi:hypothetical protein
VGIKAAGRLEKPSLPGDNFIGAVILTGFKDSRVQAKNILFNSS